MSGRGGLRNPPEDRAYWPRQLATRLGQAHNPAGTIVVLRHSVRESISGPSLNAATAAQLTDEGRALSRTFGEMLPGGVAYRLFASPIERCVETATLVADALRARGLVAGLHGKRSYLAGDFIRDPGPVVATFAKVGPHGFMKAWHEGKLPADAIIPPSRAARELLADLVAEHHDAETGTVDLHVGHDLTVATLLGLVARTGSARFRWPCYLDGAMIRDRKGGGARIWYHGEERFFTE